MGDVGRFGEPGAGTGALHGRQHHAGPGGIRVRFLSDPAVPEYRGADHQCRRRRRDGQLQPAGHRFPAGAAPPVLRAAHVRDQRHQRSRQKHAGRGLRGAAGGLAGAGGRGDSGDCHDPADGGAARRRNVQGAELQQLFALVRRGLRHPLGRRPGRVRFGCRPVRFRRVPSQRRRHGNHRAHVRRAYSGAGAGAHQPRAFRRGRRRAELFGDDRVAVDGRRQSAVGHDPVRRGGRRQRNHGLRRGGKPRSGPIREHRGAGRGHRPSLRDLAGGQPEPEDRVRLRDAESGGGHGLGAPEHGDERERGGLADRAGGGNATGVPGLDGHGQRA